MRLFDKRYSADLPLSRSDIGDMTPHILSGLLGVIAVDSLDPKDLVHARMLQEAFPKVELARLPFAGHPASKVIREGGSFQTLIDEALSLEPSAARIIAAYRAARRQSPTYFRHRARKLTKRWPDLAKQAHRQFKNLQG